MDFSERHPEEVNKFLLTLSVVCHRKVGCSAEGPERVRPTDFGYIYICTFIQSSTNPVVQTAKAPKSEADRGFKNRGGRKRCAAHYQEREPGILLIWQGSIGHA